VSRIFGTRKTCASLLATGDAPHRLGGLLA
jgi:hypothetical protein